MFLALMPHGYCFLWNIPLTLLHALSDGAIAIAYLSIPAMMYIHRDRATSEVRLVIMMFAAFILFCGVGHMLSAWNIWHGSYWFEGTWKVGTAVISVLTAFKLWQTLPNIMGIHSKLTETELLANTDHLTGLRNRRGLEQAFKRLALMEATSGSRNILMLVDLDNFKQVNDTCGHEVGDRLLQTVSQTLTRHTRTTDVTARIGGDEFAIILVGCSVPRSYAIAETIRQAVAQITLEGVSPLNQSDALVTASIGLLPISPGQSFQDVFRVVDGLLYTSKQEGRNRITLPNHQLTNRPSVA